LKQFRSAKQTLERTTAIQGGQIRRMAKGLQAQMDAVTSEYEQRINRLKEIHLREINSLIVPD
jgi:hypothetical protein